MSTERADDHLRFERSDDDGFNADVTTCRAVWRIDGKVMDTAAFNVLRVV